MAAWLGCAACRWALRMGTGGDRGVLSHWSSQHSRRGRVPGLTGATGSLAPRTAQEVSTAPGAERVSRVRGEHQLGG